MGLCFFNDLLWAWPLTIKWVFAFLTQTLHFGSPNPPLDNMKMAQKIYSIVCLAVNKPQYLALTL